MCYDIFTIDPDLFTFIVTSCGRFDLLEQTLASFSQYYDAQRIVVMEDSGDRVGADAFAARHSNIDMRFNDPKLGQLCSIDKAYASVTTPYVFHLEDDWLFEAGVDPISAVRLLQANPKLACVCLLYSDHKNDQIRARSKLITHDNRDWQMIPLNADRNWFSYTFNPSIVSIDLWRQFGPFFKYRTEAQISRFFKRKGYMTARISPALGGHIGWGRHIPDETRLSRPRSLQSWLRQGPKYLMIKAWLRIGL